MRNRFLPIVVAIMFGIVLPAQTVPSGNSPNPVSAPQTASGGGFTSSAIWQPTPEFLTAAHAACDKASQQTAVAECFIDQMAKAGAPADAVKFTRELYKSNGQVGMMGEFKEFGPIGFAWIIYPLRADMHDGLLLLNGDPPFLDPDNMQKLDHAALVQDPIFIDWRKTAPKLDVWPGNRAGGSAQIKYARVWPGDKPGDQRFLFTYPLIDGCLECTRVGFVNYWWLFDANGKFLGTRLLSVTRGAPPMRRDRIHPPAPSNAPNPSPEMAPSSPSGSPPAPPQ